MTGHPNLMAPGAESQMNEKFPYNGKLQKVCFHK